MDEETTVLLVLLLVIVILFVGVVAIVIFDRTLERNLKIELAKGGFVYAEKIDVITKDGQPVGNTLKNRCGREFSVYIYGKEAYHRESFSTQWHKND